MNALFTIGHSTHDFAHFFGLLSQHNIEVVADVRSQPLSRLPWFCRPMLEKGLKANGIKYVFLGTELGARREERECYIGNRADYRLITQTAAYRNGLDRLRKGVMKYRIALMCSEREPLDCHRTVLIARDAKMFAEVSHIKADGKIEMHEEAETRLLSLYFADNRDLFRCKAEMLDEAYERRGVQINFVKEMQPSALKEQRCDDEY